jgi:predicted ATPase
MQIPVPKSSVSRDNPAMRQAGRFLTSIELRNFRAFEEATVELRPLTVLLGPNNAGKSSILSGIRILAETLRSVDPDVPLLLSPFGTYRDLVHGNNPTRTLGFRIGFSLQPRRVYVDMNFRYRGQRRELILRDFALSERTERVLVKTRYSRDSERQVVQSLPGLSHADRRRATMPLTTTHFLPDFRDLRWHIARKIREGGTVKVEFRRPGPLESIERVERQIESILNAVRYIGPFRESPIRFYPFSGEHRSVLSPEGAGATDMLVADYFRRGTRKQELTGKVRRWFAGANVARDLAVRPVGDRSYEIRFQNAISEEIQNLTDVGYGISQVLPIIVAGYNLSPGAVFIVEQPEIHLHPRAQAELGDFFRDLYLRGVQCIIETHSEHLLMRLQRHVASGEIPPSHFALNFVSATKEGKRVRRIPIDRNGTFKHWPKGFFEERLQEAIELARAPLSRAKRASRS